MSLDDLVSGAQDLNPVKVLSEGVRVVDARIRVGRRPAAPPSRRIAY